MRYPLLALLLCTAPVLADTRDETLLLGSGIKPDAESIGTYLRTLYPDESTRRLATALAARLGERASASRDEATLRLSALGTGAVAELKKVAASADPEVRRSARRIIDQALGSVRRDVLRAALRTVRSKKFPGLTHDLLEVMPLVVDLYMLAETEAALKATARPVDIPMLRAALGAPSVSTRAAAVLALGKVFDADQVPELYPLLDHEEERVRHAAAWALADLGDRRCLATFVKLLDAKDIWVRGRSARALRHMSGKAFSYSEYTGPEERARSVAAWRAWHEAHGKTVAWKRPIAPGNRMLGRTLISLYSENRIIEVDHQGRVLWETRSVRNPWAIQGLRNGNRLVVEYATKSLVEFDETGREIWRRSGFRGYVSSMQRLENGNTLLALTNPDRIREMRNDGRTVWEIALAGRPTHATLLPNGNVLAVLSGKKRVVEVDRTGKVVWTLEGLRSPWSAQRLPNGNTLVCDLNANSVKEFSSAGKVVWSYRVQQCYDAQRLPNGKTLIADRTGVREVERDGKVHWLYKSNGRFLRAIRY